MKRTYSAHARRTKIARTLMSLAFAGSVVVTSQLAAACEQCGTHNACSEGCSDAGVGIFEASCGCGSPTCSGSSNKLDNPVMKALD